MSSETEFEFTKENIDTYLQAVAKEYRKRVGKNMPAELILIGGASVLINYGFRNATTDVDAVIEAASSMKDAINAVCDHMGLPNGWLNADFRQTASYSSRLAEVSVYYRTFSNVVHVRTVSAEYLIAMKLRAGRRYKNDLSDVIGILTEHQKRGTPITLEQIHRAVTELYGSWEELPELSRKFIQNTMNSGQIEALYERVVENERQNREMLLSFEQQYPGIMTEDNVDAITDTLQQKTDRASVRAQLQKLKENQRRAEQASTNEEKTLGEER